MFAKTDPETTLEEESRQISLAEASHVPATSGATLLPRPVATLVSLLTQSTSLSLRVGTLFGGVALDGARATTLTGLELGRAVVEGILTRAGKDIAFRSGDEHGKSEAESLLERSVSLLVLVIIVTVLTICSARDITYNSDLRVLLRRRLISLLIYNAGVGCELLTGSFVIARCDTGIHRVVAGHRGHHYPDPAGVSIIGLWFPP